MNYQKELNKIQKLLEEVNSSDDKKSDKDDFFSDGSDKEDCLKKDEHVPTLTIACQTLKIHNKIPKRKSQNLVHGLEKIKQHGGEISFIYLPSFMTSKFHGCT